MKVSEIKEKIDSFSSDERNKYLRPLLDQFSSYGKSALVNFQNRWDGSKPYEEFVKNQNMLILTLLETEIQDSWQRIRLNEGLGNLTLDTEI